jgi:hypothetical protein
VYMYGGVHQNIVRPTLGTSKQTVFRLLYSSIEIITLLFRFSGYIYRVIF